MSDHNSREVIEDPTQSDNESTPTDNLIGTAMRQSDEIKRRKVTTANYRCVKHVVPTSNKVERAFSKTKRIMTASRSSMHPKILENFMMLRENMDFWNEGTCEEAISRKDIDWKAILGEVVFAAAEVGEDEEDVHAVHDTVLND